MLYKRTHLNELAFFGSLVFFLIVSSGGHIVVGDEETQYQLTQNLLGGRGLAVSTEELVFPAQELPIFLPSQEETLLTTSAVPGRAGLTYSKYGIGQLLIAMPLYLAGVALAKLSGILSTAASARLAVSMLNGLALAGCGWLMVCIIRALGYRTGTARWLAIGFLFSSFAWPYVKTFYPQPMTTLIILGIVYTAYRWRHSRDDRWVWVMSVLMAVLILLRLSELIILPILCLYLALSSPSGHRWRWALPVSTGVMVGLGVTLVYNWLRFGSLFSTGYLEVEWSTPILVGLSGLLASPGKGVMFYAPLLWLGLIAWQAFVKKHRPEAWLFAGLWLSFLVLYAPYKYWTGGFNWGPRFLLPVVPLGIIPAAAMLEGPRPCLAKLAFAGLFLLGLIVQVPAILVDHSRYLYQEVIGSDDPAAYSRTIFQANYSPILRQWPVALELLSAYREASTRKAAMESLRQLSQIAQQSSVQNGEALLFAEFFRRNTPDFWWYHLSMVDTSYPTWVVILPWLLLLSGSVVGLWWTGRHSHG
jgi:hypothetical protein